MDEFDPVTLLRQIIVVAHRGVFGCVVGVELWLHKSRVCFAIQAVATV
jgi:hypothetical protein